MITRYVVSLPAPTVLRSLSLILWTIFRMQLLKHERSNKMAFISMSKLSSGIVPEEEDVRLPDPLVMSYHYPSIRPSLLIYPSTVYSNLSFCPSCISWAQRSSIYLDFWFRSRRWMRCHRLYAFIEPCVTASCSFLHLLFWYNIEYYYKFYIKNFARYFYCLIYVSRGHKNN